MEPGVHLLATQGCKIVNRNLSMTEWNELLVEVLPMKGPARAYAPGKELQKKTLQPPTDLARSPAAGSDERTEAFTDANRPAVEWGQTAQEPLSGGSALCVGLGKMIAAGSSPPPATRGDV